MTSSGCLMAQQGGSSSSLVWGGAEQLDYAAKVDFNRGGFRKWSLNPHIIPLPPPAAPGILPLLTSCIAMTKDVMVAGRGAFWLPLITPTGTGDYRIGKGLGIESEVS